VNDKVPHTKRFGSAHKLRITIIIIIIIIIIITTTTRSEHPGGFLSVQLLTLPPHPRPCCCRQEGVQLSPPRGKSPEVSVLSKAADDAHQMISGWIQKL
jgi:hypothetical protein